MLIEKFLQDKYNYNSEIKDNIESYIDKWRSLYVDNVKNFHDYFVYNGRRKVPQKDIQ